METASLIRGVLIGHDNRRNAPGTQTLDHVRSVVEQCREAGVNCYCKKLWIGGRYTENVADFPPDLRERRLPWSMPTERTLL